MMKVDFHFARLSLSWKILVSCFLIVLGSGYLAAVFNAALSVGMSPQAIADHYADKSLSPEEAAAIAEQGYVEEEFSLDNEEPSLDDDEEEPLEKGSMADHEAMMSDGGQMNHSASGDDTLPPQILAQVSHVHLLSFSLILLSLGALACLTQLSESFKAALIVLFFFSLWGDIISLNLVRFVSADFSYLTLTTGAMGGICFAFISFRVFWELWFTKTRRQ